MFEEGNINSIYNYLGIKILNYNPKLGEIVLKYEQALLHELTVLLVVLVLTSIIGWFIWNIIDRLLFMKSKSIKDYIKEPN